jgi:hypothetical protein
LNTTYAFIYLFKKDCIDGFDTSFEKQKVISMIPKAEPITRPWNSLCTFCSVAISISEQLKKFVIHAAKAKTKIRNNNFT